MTPEKNQKASHRDDRRHTRPYRPSHARLPGCACVPTMPPSAWVGLLPGGFVSTATITTTLRESSRSRCRIFAGQTISTFLAARAIGARWAAATGVFGSTLGKTLLFQYQPRNGNLARQWNKHLARATRTESAGLVVPTMIDFCVTRRVRRAPGRSLA